MSKATDEKARVMRVQIASDAARVFANHVLTREGEGRWFCARPRTGIYSFRVILSPGLVLIAGDVGGYTVLKHSDGDSERWARGATCLDYALGKCEASREGSRPREPKSRGGDWTPDALWAFHALRRWAELMARAEAPLADAGTGCPRVPCCDRVDVYNGYGSDGPRLFTCPKGCSCHD